MENKEKHLNIVGPNQRVIHEDNNKSGRRYYHSSNSALTDSSNTEEEIIVEDVPTEDYNVENDIPENNDHNVESFGLDRLFKEKNENYTPEEGELEELFKDDEEFYNNKQKQEDIEIGLNDNQNNEIEKSEEEIEIGLNDNQNNEIEEQDVEIGLNSDEKDDLNVEVNGNEEPEIDLDGNDNLNVDVNGKDKEENEKQNNNTLKEKEGEIYVPAGLIATVGLQAVAPAILGGVLGPAVVLMAILWLANKDFKLPVSEKAYDFKNKVHNNKKSKDLNFGSGNIEEESQQEQDFNEIPSKDLVEIFEENKEVFENAFEKVKDIDGINNIPCYNELIDIIDSLNDVNKTREEKEEEINRFIEIGNIFLGNLENNKDILEQVEQKCNEKKVENPIKNLFSAFSIIKNAKKVDRQVREEIHKENNLSFAEKEKNKQNNGKSFVQVGYN